MQTIGIKELLNKYFSLPSVQWLSFTFKNDIFFTRFGNSSKRTPKRSKGIIKINPAEKGIQNSETEKVSIKNFPTDLVNPEETTKLEQRKSPMISVVLRPSI